MSIKFVFDIDGFPYQTSRVVLDSNTYEMTLKWNERDEAWWYYIGDVGADPTVGFKLSTMTDILAPYRYMDNIPQGYITLLGLRDPRTRAGRYNIGYKKDVFMIYTVPD